MPASIRLPSLECSLIKLCVIKSRQFALQNIWIRSIIMVATPTKNKNRYCFFKPPINSLLFQANALVLRVFFYIRMTRRKGLFSIASSFHFCFFRLAFFFDFSLEIPQLCIIYFGCKECRLRRIKLYIKNGNFFSRNSRKHRRCYPTIKFCDAP